MEDPLTNMTHIPTNPNHLNFPVERHINTQNSDFTLLLARPEDASLVVSFMRQLGEFQNMRDKITATPKKIALLMEQGLGEAVFGIYAGKLVSFAYYHTKSSAFTGRSGLYIDGFFVDSAMRGKGLGNMMMHFLAKHAQDRGCELLEWGCLDWNSNAIDFYQKQGAYCIDNMRIYRLTPESISHNASLF